MFLIGFNQATALNARAVGEQDAYLDALFNRNDRSIATLYEKARGEKGPSPTRQNLNRVTALLKAKGISDVLQTNVVCYATSMSGALAHPEHKGGSSRGTEIFETLLDEIRPPVLIAHGAKTSKWLAKLLKCELPELPRTKDDGICSKLIEANIGGHEYRANIFLTPSLAPPAWNRWATWAWPHLDRVCEGVRHALQSKGQYD